MQKKSSSKGYEKPETAIKLTPLCDVSMVLLITLMIISPFVVQSLIRISETSAVEGVYADGESEEPVIVHVKEEAIEVNTKRVKNDMELAERIREEFLNRRDKTLMVTAERKVPLGRVVNVLDISRQNGAESLSVLRSEQ